MAADARIVAVDALSAIDKGAYSELYLASAMKKAGLDRRDAALCTAVCAGVLRNRMLIDHRIAAYSSVKLKKIAPRVLNILRAAACQIYFLDRVPDSAAVNAAVDQARKSAGQRSAGFVNAVLRHMVREKENAPEPDKKDNVNYLSVKYSHPEYLVRYFISRIGEDETQDLLKANNTPAPIVARINTILTSYDEAVNELQSQDVIVKDHPFLSNALILSHTGNIAQLDAYKKGYITIQDTASSFPPMVLSPTPGSRVLDLCAAPGGKSFLCASIMENRGEIISCDLHEHRTALIKNGAERLGIKIIVPMQSDGTVFVPEWENAFDFVLLDAPCSGIGVIRRKNEIRYKTQDELAGIPALQRALFENAGRYVKPGGIIVYSTCTLIKAENEDVFTDFLKHNSNFSQSDFTLPGIGRSENGMMTLWPHKYDTDGFFIARARKSNA